MLRQHFTPEWIGSVISDYPHDPVSECDHFNNNVGDFTTVRMN